MVRESPSGGSLFELKTEGLEQTHEGPEVEPCRQILVQAGGDELGVSNGDKGLGEA